MKGLGRKFLLAASFVFCFSSTHLVQGLSTSSARQSQAESLSLGSREAASIDSIQNFTDKTSHGNRDPQHQDTKGCVFSHCHFNHVYDASTSNLIQDSIQFPSSSFPFGKNRQLSSPFLDGILRPPIHS